MIYIVLGLGVLCYLYPFHKQNTIPYLKIEIPLVIADDMFTVHVINESLDDINDISKKLDDLLSYYKSNSTKISSIKNSEELFKIEGNKAVYIAQLTNKLIDIKKNTNVAKVGLNREMVDAIDSVYAIFENYSNFIYNKFNELEVSTALD